MIVKTPEAIALSAYPGATATALIVVVAVIVIGAEYRVELVVGVELSRV